MSPRLRRLRAGLPWLRRFVFWTGALAVSLTALLFAWAAQWADVLQHAVVRLSPFAPFVMLPVGLGVSLALTRSVFPGAQGSGIPQVIAAIDMNSAGRRAVLSLRVALGKIALTVLGLACGASIGREGPTVQIGAAIMRALGQVARVPAATARGLILAGGAAGIAAAFNTPLAGVVFAIEELSHSFEQRTSGTVLTAVIIAGIATLALGGGGSYFGQTSAMLPVGVAWEAVVACAVLGGVFGGAFSRALLMAADGFPGAAGRFVFRRPIVFAMLCGLVLAGLGYASGGATYGTGYAQARAMVVSYASGIPGGIFAPSLAVGAGLGRTVAHWLPSAPAGAVVLLGMVAYFSGVVQAPVTAAVIVMEMTDNQDMTIPLMATSFVAYVLSRVLCPQPLYAGLAERYLASLRRAEAMRLGMEERL